MTLPTEDEI